MVTEVEIQEKNYEKQIFSTEQGNKALFFPSEN